MNSFATVTLVRVLLAAGTVELALFAITALFYFLPAGPPALPYVVPPACLGLA